MTEPTNPVPQPAARPEPRVQPVEYEVCCLSEDERYCEVAARRLDQLTLEAS